MPLSSFVQLTRSVKALCFLIAVTHGAKVAQTPCLSGAIPTAANFTYFDDSVAFNDAVSKCGQNGNAAILARVSNQIEFDAIIAMMNNDVPSAQKRNFWIGLTDVLATNTPNDTSRFSYLDGLTTGYSSFVDVGLGNSPWRANQPDGSGNCVSWQVIDLRWVVSDCSSSPGGLLCRNECTPTTGTSVPTKSPIITTSPTRNPTKNPVVTVSPTHRPTSSPVVTVMPTDGPSTGPTVVDVAEANGLGNGLTQLIAIVLSGALGVMCIGMLLMGAYMRMAKTKMGEMSLTIIGMEKKMSHADPAEYEDTASREFDFRSFRSSFGSVDPSSPVRRGEFEVENPLRHSVPSTIMGAPYRPIISVESRNIEW